MIRTRIAAAALVALCSLAAGRAEASSESAAFGARTAFDMSIFAPQPTFKRSVAGTWQAMAAASGSSSLFRVNAAMLATAEVSATSASPALEVDLAQLLNKQLKTSLKYSVGGKDIWVGGAFDRAQNAYVSILVDGSPARFFDVKKLLDKEESLPLGTARYKMYLAPNIINQMKSEIVLENEANEDEKIRISLKKMMDAAGAAGHAVTLGTHNYRAFYTDDVKNGTIDASSRVFTFLLVDAKGQIHVFIIPADLVPSDKIAVFKMFEDKRVGLMQAGGKLKIYENP